MGKYVKLSSIQVYKITAKNSLNLPHASVSTPCGFLFVFVNINEPREPGDLLIQQRYRNRTSNVADAILESLRGMCKCGDCRISRKQVVQLSRPAFLLPRKRLEYLHKQLLGHLNMTEFLCL